MSASRIDYLHRVTECGNMADTMFQFSEGRRATFGAFHDTIARLAEQIGTRITRRSGLICIIGHRKSGDAIHAMFGVLSAGFGFLFCDSHWPDERIQEIFSSCDPDAVIACDPARSNLATGPRGLFLCQDGLLVGGSGAQDMIDARTSDGADLAYAIYTSGSTGRSKVVGISHRAICHFLDSFDAALNLPSDARWLSLSALSFDMSIVDLFYPAFKGATNILLDGIYSINDLVNGIHDNRITHLSAVSSVIDLLSRYIDRIDVEKLRTLRAIHFGGERFDVNSARKLLTHLPNVTMMFGYGVAEASPASLMNVFTSVPDWWTALPVGSPLPGIKVGLTKSGDDGASSPGELVIGGPVLMNGYVGDEARTCSVLRQFAFDPDRSAKQTELGYFTGDMFRRDNDGVYWFEGRRDDLVKRNGFLVSLTQIEQAVKGIHRAECVVAYLAGHGLTATLNVAVLNSGSRTTSIKHDLTRILPPHLLPDSVVFIDDFTVPHLESGKIDRRSTIAALQAHQSHRGEA